eukprot:SAG11_NODE_17521_length_516_cov_0.621103_1_plen_102_part_00
MGKIDGQFVLQSKFSASNPSIEAVRARAHQIEGLVVTQDDKVGSGASDSALTATGAHTEASEAWLRLLKALHVWRHRSRHHLHHHPRLHRHRTTSSPIRLA